MATGGTHAPTTEEWGCAQFNEGFASFLGDVSRYWFNRSDIADTCMVGEFECLTLLEPSPATACQSANPCGGSTARRTHLAVNRFFWDAYDSTSDGICSEALQQTYGALLGGIGNFSTGTGNGHLSEWTNTTEVNDDNNSSTPSSDDDGFQDSTSPSDKDELRALTTSVSNNRRDQTGAWDYVQNYAITAWLTNAANNNCAFQGN